MDELEQLEETIICEIKRTEKEMHDTDLREDTDKVAKNRCVELVVKRDIGVESGMRKYDRCTGQ